MQYVRNYDADTITVNIPNLPPIVGQEINVRVAGIDTAEIRGGTACSKDMARKAKTYVAGVLQQAKRIDLKNVSRGKYFRLVAEVVADGRELGQHLISKKLAIPYDGGQKTAFDWCATNKVSD